ncbi:gap junction delta-4 protein-like [Varanus komodoensis]|uniref:Gap junction protein n=1 Tax=Varanus komodoensis TaxID=61221 RepID=A0A8D2LE13_VARKO|nr:gap junction delta-4 protein-like [Varanus komodoensis]
MKTWDIICFLFIGFNYNVTIIGKIWITHVILLRLIVILLVAYPVYQDEQFNFFCSTSEQHCRNICYDHFAPVSHSRFWVIETMSVLLPYAVFSAYVMHNVVRQVVKAYFLPDHQYKEINPFLGQKVTKKSPEDASRRRIGHGPNGMAIPDFSRAYAIQLLLRLLIEVGFVVADYYIFGFFVPKVYVCREFPCPFAVDCFISRPAEKFIMLVSMWIFRGFFLLLSLIDLVFAFHTNRNRNQRKKLLFERFELDEKCGLGLHQNDRADENVFSPGTSSMADD